ncbi:MAG: hypothetical protein AABY22_25890 [Nanoarchaeota archaeon]
MRIKEILTNPDAVFLIGGLIFGFGLVSLYYKRNVTAFVLMGMGLLLFILAKRRAKDGLKPINSDSYEKVITNDKYKVKGQWEQ